nr:hypothetical protein [Tanacetum cinerariifolium]
MPTLLSSVATFSMEMFPFGHYPEGDDDVSLSVQAEEGPNFAIMDYTSSNSDLKVLDDEDEEMIQPKFEQKTVKTCISKIEFVKPKQPEKKARKTIKKDKGVIDSGCSRHMTKNMSYLTDYEEIDGGYVAFGGNTKGEKITGKGSGPNWLFDIDALTRTMNYKPIAAGTQSNGFVGTNACDNTVDEDPSKGSECKDQEQEDNVNNTNNVNAAADMLEDISTFNHSSDHQDDDELADINNLDTKIQVSPVPTTRVHNDHSLDQVIGYLQSATQTKNITNNLEEHRLQKIVSQLVILGEHSLQEDLNLKFLRFLPSKWNTHVVIGRNKSDLDKISIDDLYNNFKIIEQEVKRNAGPSSSSGSQNMAFVSTPRTNNNVDVSTVFRVSTVSPQVSTANLNDATIGNGFEMAIPLLSMRAKRFFQKTGKKITINGSDTANYDKAKVECFNYHKMGHFARKCRVPMNQENITRNQKTTRRKVNMEDTSSIPMVAINGAGFD